jgi:hypothetical protein
VRSRLEIFDLTATFPIVNGRDTFTPLFFQKWSAEGWGVFGAMQVGVSSVGWDKRSEPQPTELIGGQDCAAAGAGAMAEISP